MLGEYDPNGLSDIPDPYYGGKEGFQKNFEQITRSINNFLITINK